MMPRIEVGFKQGVTDASGNSVKSRIKRYLGLDVDSVRTIEVYNIDGKLDDSQLDRLGSELFADPIIQDFSFKKPLATGFDWLIEVGFRPGVTDNVGRTSGSAIRDTVGADVTVYTSKQYLIKGSLTKAQAEGIASDLLANQLIERHDVYSKDDWKAGMTPILPKVTDKFRPETLEIDLDVSDEELMDISRKGVLALNLDEMKRIRDYFDGLGRKPTDAELECLAQTWSEHCKHKIFNAKIEYVDGKKTEEISSLFKTYIQNSTDRIAEDVDWLVSLFKDNAGVIRFNDDWNLVMKAETHNSPSALDPYGGALTGIVGVNRDPLGTGRGSKLIFNTDVFCFASPFFDKPLPKRLLHPRRIMDGVRLGVEHGGNKSGIPTVNGSLVFDDRFAGKPLVYCGTGGLIPAKISGEPSEVKVINPGDLIIMAGGRVGKDGIHGATFSSEELHEGSPATAVQIGDPFTQKKMVDFILEARDLGLFTSITDNGAGGLSSSVGETAQITGGAEIWLDKVPLKYPGLKPWEILISEAQERMTMAVPPESLDRYKALAKKHEVEVTVVGKYTDSGKFEATYGKDTVCDIGMDFLHDGVPQLKLKAVWKEPKLSEPKLEPKDLLLDLKQMLGRLNICSKESIVRQYDHEVQGGSVIKPMVGLANDGPSDAAVVRPLLDSMEGVAVGHGIVPRYSDIDTYHMMANAIDEGIRNLVAVGASLKQMAGLDNFCWCDPVKSEKTPDGEYKLAQLVRANKALYDYCTAYGVPCISGKDSMKNDYSIDDTKISIPPTVLFSTIAKVEDVRRCVTMDVKNPGDIVYVLGKTKDELGGSEYYAMIGHIGKNVPKVDAKSAKRSYDALHKAITSGLVASCHDCSDGGLAVALAESAFAGGLGLEIDLGLVPGDDMPSYKRLFSESASRFVVTVSPENRTAFEKAMAGNDLAAIGKVRDDSGFIVLGEFQTTIDDLKESWQVTLR